MRKLYENFHIFHFSKKKSFRRNYTRKYPVFYNIFIKCVVNQVKEKKTFLSNSNIYFKCFIWHEANLLTSLRTLNMSFISELYLWLLVVSKYYVINVLQTFKILQWPYKKNIIFMPGFCRSKTRHPLFCDVLKCIE